MINDIVSVGDKLDLMKIQRKSNVWNNNQIYKSKLIDHIEDDKARITMPIERGRIIPLSIGDKYILFFYTKKGLFQCNAQITDRRRDNNLYILEIQFLSELEKYQRRQFYRLECMLDITYHVSTEAERVLTSKLKNDDFKNQNDKLECFNQIEEYRKDWNKGIITNLSGGGARFNSEEMLESGNPIIFYIELITKKGIKKYLLEANVISSYKLPNHIGIYEHRMQFINIKNEERETIIKFIFEEECRQRKNEKGLNAYNGGR